jgi:antagonist of KipI
MLPRWRLLGSLSSDPYMLRAQPNPYIHGNWPTSQHWTAQDLNMPSPPFLEIISPGLLTTVQDAGRWGWERLGISRGGAIDFSAYAWANRLARNEPGAAVLESLLQGPTVKPSIDVWLATAGFTEIAVDGRTVAGWSGFLVAAGSEVTCGEPRGARGYIAVHEGIDVPLVLGSRSTNLESRFGGYGGRALERGDRLPLSLKPRPAPAMRGLRLPSPPRLERPLTVRVVMGTRVEEFSARAVADFLATRYGMSPRGNHVGIRLDGPAVESGSRGARLSEPMPIGGVQITPAGQPIILLNARGTIGGYPVIATVITPDTWRLGQLRPGEELQWEEVAFDQAQKITRHEYRELATAEPTEVCGS